MIEDAKAITALERKIKSGEIMFVLFSTFRLLLNLFFYLLEM
jgi:hypothetical protein